MFTDIVDGRVGSCDTTFVKRPSPSLRSRLGSAVPKLTIKELDELVESVLGHAALGEKIRRVLLPEHFLYV